MSLESHEQEIARLTNILLDSSLAGDLDKVLSTYRELRALSVRDQLENLRLSRSEKNKLHKELLALKK